MYRVAVYGKGGAGKSTVSANLSYLLSEVASVLHVGCDPKHDSTMLLAGSGVTTFSSEPDPLPLVVGMNGISCIECGGAEPGRGCAGKGLEMLLSRISDIEADYRVCDVLGDVVCGGFSVPARASECDAVILVVSGEFMSLYAANNILRGLANINPGECVMGLVLNRRGVEGEDAAVGSFAEAAGLPIVCDIPRSRLFGESEAAGEVLCRRFPDSPEAETLRELARRVASRPPLNKPSPLSDEAMADIAAGRPPRRGCAGRRRRACGFDCHDSERNITYGGRMALPSCTSHGAADAAMRISDAAVVMHGPANCAYLAEYAYVRRILNSSAERSGPVPPCNLYSTGMDATSAFTGAGILGDAVRRAVSDGFGHVFVVPTCPSEIIGADIRSEAIRLSTELGADIIPAIPDGTFLGSKFGGTFGVFRALAERMPPMETVPGTVNLIARWFYGVGRDRNISAIRDILSLLDLEPNVRFLDHCTYDGLMRFRSGEFDIQLGRSRLNSRLADMVSEVTGRRRALALDVPTGLRESAEWIRGLSAYTGRGDLEGDALSTLERMFRDGISMHRDRTEGRRAILYCLSVRDVAWQVEALGEAGMDVTVMYADGGIVDNNEMIPDLGVPVIRDADIGTLGDLCSRDVPDIIVTNDPDRVSKLGFPRAPLGARRMGIAGSVEWVGTVADCMSLPVTGWEAGL